MPDGSTFQTLNRESPTFHRDATRARWAEYEVRHGAGFTARHSKLYESDLRAALANDAVRNGNRQAQADLKACGGDKDAALALAFARIDAAFGAGKPAAQAEAA